MLEHHLHDLMFLGQQADQNFWRELCSRLDPDVRSQQQLVVWDWRFLDGTYIHQVFPWDAWQRIVDASNGTDLVLIIDSMFEAPHYDRHLRPLVSALVNSGTLRHSDIINWNSGQETAPDIITANCLGAFRKFSRDAEPTAVTSHHFIMLARVPKMLRVLAAVAVVERGLDAYGCVSCGSRDLDSIDMLWKDLWVPPHQHHRFPMLLDGPVSDFNNKQFDVSDDRIRQAAVNVICETSQDDHIYANSPPNTIWSDRLISEKTSKALRLLQLPIWISVPGTVQSVRDLGFDVFDDVIDHSYDNEANIDTRISLAIDQLQRFCQMSLGEISDLRTDLWPRLLQNKQKAEVLIDNADSDFITLLDAALRKRR